MKSAARTIGYAAWGRRLNRLAFRDRRPIAGSIAPTHRCNLGCIHCYLQTSRKQPELSTSAWLGIIDQLEQAGCLWLVITGGEPLLRPDFADIYMHAGRKGFLVNVFTNGTLIDDAIMGLFEKMPPFSVEISLYGHSPETYALVTGEGRARDAAFRSARRLARQGTAVQLKTVVLRQNAHELEGIRRFSEELGVPFRFDTQVSPCLDGSLKPCFSRLDDDSAIRLDVEDGKRHATLTEFLEDGRMTPRRSLFNCGAGMTSFHVYPGGQLALCVCDVPLFDLKKGSFMDGWDGAVRQRRESPLPEDHPCCGCCDQSFCGVCPPVARMETGSDAGFPAHLCEAGKKRRQAIQRGMDRMAGQKGMWREEEEQSKIKEAL
ncbi:MAG: radical SAM protein [Pseudomonadota bacterium]